MKTDAQWSDVRGEMVCDHGEYEYCSNCEMEFVRQVQVDAMGESLQVLRKCWQDADKRDSMGEYHIMVAKAIEKRVNEIKEGK